MNTAEQIIAIILSSFLALFLLLSIIFVILAIKVVKSVRRVSVKAEHLVDRAESITDFMSHAAKPMSIAYTLANIYDRTFKRQSRKGKGK